MSARWVLSVLVLAMVMVPVATAEVREIEVIGVAPIGTGGSRGNPRDAAIVAAQKEAVTRVATEFLREADPAAAGIDLEEVFGKNFGGYTSRFRIVEDRGERPGGFADDPGVSGEYVMVVDVHVDADRVRQRLVEAGLVQGSGPAAIGRSILLEVRGLQSYSAYEALREALLSGAGARTVQALEWTRGRSLLAVESEQSAQDLLDRLLGNLPPGLEVLPHSVDEERMRLRVEWSPPPAAREGDSAPASWGESTGSGGTPPRVEARPPRGRN